MTDQKPEPDLDGETTAVTTSLGDAKEAASPQGFRDRFADTANSTIQTLTETPRRLLIPATLYVLLLLIVGVTTSIYQSFGLLSLTTGIIVLGVTYHPAGNVTISSRQSKFIYTASGLAFIGIGLWYLGSGIITPSPWLL